MRLAIRSSRSVSSSVVEHRGRPRRSAGRRTSEIVRPFTRTARLCGLQPSPAHVGTAAARDTARGSPARARSPLRSGAAGSGSSPSKPAPNGSSAVRAFVFLRAGSASLRRAAAGGAEEQQVAQLLRQPAERHREIDAEGLAQSQPSASLDELLVALRPRRDRAVLQRQRLVGHEPQPGRSRTPRRAPGTPGRRRAAS